MHACICAPCHVDEARVGGGEARERHDGDLAVAHLSEAEVVQVEVHNKADVALRQLVNDNLVAHVKGLLHDGQQAACQHVLDHFARHQRHHLQVRTRPRLAAEA